jgi:hypothetical protein
LLPDFLIIGAQKSGTTSLRLALGQHPAVTMSLKGEVHYFDWNFHRGIDWYRAHFPTRRLRERSLRQRGEFATGEKSPYYLLDPLVPARVRDVLPEAKLVVLLRDPVARALSGYHHARRHGTETLSFEEALACELRQGDRPPAPADPRSLSLEYNWRSYIARGLYAEQLERWLGCFDRAQIHVALSERYFADPALVVGEIQRFLGLSTVVPPKLTPRGRAGYEPVPDAMRLQLQEIFAPDVRRLTELLGENPGWW